MDSQPEKDMVHSRNFSLDWYVPATSARILHTTPAHRGDVYKREPSCVELRTMHPHTMTTDFFTHSSLNLHRTAPSSTQSSTMEAAPFTEILRPCFKAVARTISTPVTISRHPHYHQAQHPLLLVLFGTSCRANFAHSAPTWLQSITWHLFPTSLENAIRSRHHRHRPIQLPRLPS